MPQAARKDDPLADCDGIIESACSSDVFINGIPAATVDSMSSDHSPYGPPHPPHVPNPIKTGSSTVFINGKPAARKDDPFECGHVVASGSSDVNIGD
jgi:uncharacterized Zn-binding protein involved in type VI secretion